MYLALKTNEATAYLGQWKSSYGRTTPLLETVLCSTEQLILTAAKISAKLYQMHCGNQAMWCTTYQKFWWAILCIFRWLFFTNFTTRVNKRQIILKAFWTLVPKILYPGYQCFVFFFLFFQPFIAAANLSGSPAGQCNLNPCVKSLTPSVPIWKVTNRKKRNKKRNEKKDITQCSLTKAKHPT